MFLKAHKLSDYNCEGRICFDIILGLSSYWVGCSVDQMGRDRYKLVRKDERYEAGMACLQKPQLHVPGVLASQRIGCLHATTSIPAREKDAAGLSCRCL